MFRFVFCIPLLAIGCAAASLPVSPAAQARTEQWLEQRGGGFVQNIEVANYFSNLLHRLSTGFPADCQSRFVNYSWSLQILKSSQANAYSFGNGRVVITRGLVLETESEDQLASILAHEMAHHCLGHPLQESSLTLGSAPQFLFTPAQELDADKLGVEILSRAGFDPSAAAAALAIPYREKLPNVASGQDQNLRHRLAQLYVLGVARRLSLPSPGARDYRAMKIALVKDLR